MRVAVLRSSHGARFARIALSGWNAQLWGLAHLRERVPVFAVRVHSDAGEN